MLRNSLLALSLAALPLAALLPLAAQAAAPLAIEIYNPAEKAIFPVSSELVTGKHDAVLIDAQFQRNDAQALVAKIKASMQGKLAYWSPILKDNAPEKLVLPEVLEGDHLTLEGQPLEIKGLTGPAPERSYVWIPSLKAVVGGVVVSSGIHVWVADTQSPKSRQDWLATLRGIEALKPATVIPGHYLGQIPQGTQAVAFTADYLKSFEQQAAKAKDAKALIDTMQKAWPQLAEPSSLELSAKVIKGEMKWPN
ncbi:hypothetical protein PST407_02190 [Pseudomonas syringae pv. tomato]|uniref:MBL fold metallo-hydrolase n=1 Tax=Pseudomonas syringae group genomosp. 3 TaxID=251701 RepID=UPI0007502FC3|nr:MBL fold metallo-hydrolase [Pseudomonas syringae group genomosp. 3]KUR49092.1 hypothetical protein PST407_02190 [Pseudomonas syringae pv. tomato]